MDDAAIYQLAKARLAETQQAITALVEAGYQIPAEAYELAHLYEAAIRWYEAVMAAANDGPDLRHRSMLKPRREEQDD